MQGKKILSLSRGGGAKGLSGRATKKRTFFVLRLPLSFILFYKQYLSTDTLPKVRTFTYKFLILIFGREFFFSNNFEKSANFEIVLNGDFFVACLKHLQTLYVVRNSIIPNFGQGF